jgi:hypothetical protein
MKTLSMLNKTSKIMAEYIISEKALEDLNNIGYTAENWSVEQNSRYYNLIVDRIMFKKGTLVSKDFENVRKKL